MWKSVTSRLLIGCLVFLVTPSLACGPWLPPRWLASGGAAVGATPEFFWEIEVRRMASELKSAPDWNPPPWSPCLVESVPERVALADVADFEKAIAEGRVSQTMKAAHLERRRTLQSGKAPFQLKFDPADDHEFADYHRGAMAFNNGREEWADAATAWESILKRHKSERQHRSTWAAYMLGRLDLSQSKFADAARWFSKVREFANEGLDDSLGLAADSIGWEAHCRMKNGESKDAAHLYLEQLAIGDASAVVSLKHVLPFPGQITAEGDLEPSAGWVQSAKDPVLRQLITASLLSRFTPLWEPAGTTMSECRQWLDAVTAAGLDHVPDAEHLGWVAYNLGRYDDASDWLAVSSMTSAEAHWLKAKLLRRDGKLAEAAEHLSKAVRLLTPLHELTKTHLTPDMILPDHAARADLGGVQLERGEFVAAIDAFRAADMQLDATYVAERVLTPEELKAYVDDQFPWSEQDETESADAEIVRSTNRATHPEALEWRWMLARRLIRGRRYEEARPYLPALVRPTLDKYVSALHQAGDATQPKAKRARAWFEAAILARHDGFEMMSTRAEPDGEFYSGSFPMEHIAGERAAGMWSRPDSSGNGIQPPIVRPVSLKVSDQEKDRLEKSRLRHEVRFQYRYLATEHCLAASRLLPDNTPELADVLNTAGNWLKARDPEAADRFLQLLERRAWNTKIGKAVLENHWFVNVHGPWSHAAYEARGAEY